MVLVARTDFPVTRAFFSSNQAIIIIIYLNNKLAKDIEEIFGGFEGLQKQCYFIIKIPPLSLL